MSRAILAVLSDTHGNHKLGLLNPKVTLFDEDEEGEPAPYTPALTGSQQYLWKLYKKNLKKVVKLADGDDIVVVHNGDLTQGRKYVEQWVSTREADQVLIGVSNMLPIMKLPNLRAVRFIFGTGSHVGGEGSTEILAVAQLRARYPQVDVRGYYHGLLEIDGAVVDVAHHGPNQSKRIWLEGNIARYYLRDLMMKELRIGKKPPDLVARGHYHSKVDEVVGIDWMDQSYESRLVVTPAMCMLGDYGRQVVRSPGQVTNGMAVFEIVDGRVLPTRWMTKTMDIRTKEQI